MFFCPSIEKFQEGTLLCAIWQKIIDMSTTSHFLPPSPNATIFTRQPHITPHTQTNTQLSIPLSPSIVIGCLSVVFRRWFTHPHLHLLPWCTVSCLELRYILVASTPNVFTMGRKRMRMRRDPHTFQDGLNQGHHSQPGVLYCNSVIC